MTSVHVPPVRANYPAPCHGESRLSGGPAQCWCVECGNIFQCEPGRLVLI